MRGRLAVDAPRVEDMELVIHWRMRHQQGFVYEVDAAAVQPLLPRGIYPKEARPGVALVFAGFNDYEPGNVIAGAAQPRFIEFTRFVLVQPDLTVRMPIPRFTFFVLRIGSDHKPFVDQEIDLLHLPSFLSETARAESNDAGTDVRIVDDAGTIQHLRNTHPAPVYREDAFFGQYYTVQDGRLWFGAWSWRGVACVHQRAGDAGGPAAHPFLTGVAPTLDLGALGPSYLQVFTRPGEVSEQRFYAPRLVRALDREAR